VARRIRGIEHVGYRPMQARLLRQERQAGTHLLTALMAGAQVAQNRWKEIVPVLTGTYRRSIHMEGRQRGTTAEVVVGTNLQHPPYPVFLEYGTSRMAPRPSARPAFDQTLTKVLQVAQRVFVRLWTAD